MFSAATKSGKQASAANYIEDVFSTYLYTGNGSTQTITNNINLSTYGGLVWIKSRSAATDNKLTDTTRGATKALVSNMTSAQTTDTNGLTAFGASGFTVGTDTNYNNNAATYVSWTFRKQAKFFDVVTYTGNGLSSNVISHSLGVAPGMIIAKRTNGAGGWAIWHRGNGTTTYGLFALNDTAAATANFSAAPTATTFDAYNIWDTGNPANASGATYVAYLFAHNAGGFGLTGTDNVISCGSFTTDSNGQATVNLGYEPQFVLTKMTSSAGYDWIITDNMRGYSVSNLSLGLPTGKDAALRPNTSGAETANQNWGSPNATGFDWNALAPNTYIYIAIRRGPMKTPTSGTSVFSPITANAAQGTAQTTNFVIDSQWKAKRAVTDTLNTSIDDRLRGVSTTATASGNYLITSSTAAEATTNATTQAWNNTGFQIPTYYASVSDVFWNFARAPGFFDEVCYTGTGVSNINRPHNLTVVPEMIIHKTRNAAGTWYVYHAGIGTSKYLQLNDIAGAASGALFSNLTSTTFRAPDGGTETYIAYLFASCPGVSKVGSYTGNGTTQTINCGFTGGARFVLIKRTDSTGDWYVYDTARGMTSLTDPYLLLNSTAAEAATLGSVTTVSGGFALNAAILAAINTNAASYIYLAIA